MPGNGARQGKVSPRGARVSSGGGSAPGGGWEAVHVESHPGGTGRGGPEQVLGPLSLYLLEFSIASKTEARKWQISWVTSNEHLGAGVSCRCCQSMVGLGCEGHVLRGPRAPNLVQEEILYGASSCCKCGEASNPKGRPALQMWRHPKTTGSLTCQVSLGLQ